MSRSSHKIRFAVFGNVYQADKSSVIQTFFDYLDEHDAEVYVERTFYDNIKHVLRCHGNISGVFDHSNFDVDVVVSMGGDGTFLKAVSRIAAKGIPILGINMGRLGFLADVLPGEIVQVLSDILNDHYKIESRSIIEVEADGRLLTSNPYALNEIAVLKRDNASMISIGTCINGEFLVTYLADGLIVSTPTGSTAYSLSNGGPIIEPRTGVLCLTPVAPHSLNMRPIVISDNSEIALTIESRNHSFLVAIDGRSEKLHEATHLKIRKAPHAVNLIQWRGKRYFPTLRKKMMWGADTRDNVVVACKDCQTSD